MKPIKTFKVGSRAFFEGMEGFVPKDNDELCIMDEFLFKDKDSFRAYLHEKDVIFSRNMSKKEFMEDARLLPMKIGKFLVPEFVDWLGVTIKDLKKLKDVIEKIDDKHQYERVIYDAYIENGGFFLTDQQRSAAYQKYLEARK